MRYVLKHGRVLAAGMPSGFDPGAHQAKASCKVVPQEEERGSNGWGGTGGGVGCLGMGHREASIGRLLPSVLQLVPPTAPREGTSRSSGQSPQGRPQNRWELKKGNSHNHNHVHTHF